MLSKNAAAFGVEALIGKKRPIDLEISEATLIESKFTANKQIKTELLPYRAGKKSDTISSLPPPDDVKIKLEKPEDGLTDDPRFCFDYIQNGNSVLKALHEETSKTGTIVNYETGEMSGQSSIPTLSNYQFNEGGSGKYFGPISLRRESCHCSGRISSFSGISIELLNQELWAQFHQHQTEMIITKNGRRMFPVIKIRIFGLDPDAFYLLYLDNELLDSKRYRYAYPNSRWTVSGTGEPLGHNQVFVHPDSPATGKRWMDAQLISFDKLKLNNNKATEAKGQLFFHSMQKYVPRIWVQKISNSEIPSESEEEENVIQLEFLVNREKAEKFIFRETSFITVTAYQNQQITRLKINSNPFAKGFRENSKHKNTTLCLKQSSVPHDLDSKMTQCIKDAFQTKNLYPSFPSFFPRIPPIHLDHPLLPYHPYSSSESFLAFQANNPLVPSSFSYATLLMPNPVFQKSSDHQNQSYAQSQLRTIPFVLPNVNGVIPQSNIFPCFPSNSMNRDMFFKSIISNSFKITTSQDSFVKIDKVKK